MCRFYPTLLDGGGGFMSNSRAGRTTHSGPPAAFSNHREVAAAFRRGRPLMIPVRNSTEQGVKARRDVINELHFVVEEAYNRYGIEVERYLPDDETLHRMLREASARKSSQDGRPFENRFLELDLRGACNCVIVLSLGSGAKVDDATLTQPYVSHVGRLVTQYEPCAVLVKSLKRLCRNTWAAGELGMRLKRIGAWVGDVEGLVKPGTQEGDLRLFLAAMEGEREAIDIGRKNSRGLADASDPEMVDGRCRSAIRHAVPPGLARVRLKGRFALGPQMLCLDAPRWHPDESEVAYGLPSVFEEDGSRVDQVANVRFLLSQLGRPKVSTRDLISQLHGRRFSTEGMRLKWGPEAIWHRLTVPEVLHRVVREHLEFYRTGKLPIRVDPSGDNDFDIVNCAPPGGWMTEADYERITAFLAVNDARLGRKAVGLLSGLRVTANGVPAVLTTVRDQRPNRHEQDRVPLAYTAKTAESYDGSAQLDRKRRGRTARQADALFYVQNGPEQSGVKVEDQP